ncbi:MAG: SpoIIE family protein phosphatase [Candidatus Omnitrophica bacterium]|nr:SpoIIE family protein phosphatase [Candidatus Omnitrophota bacterium]
MFFAVGTINLVVLTVLGLLIWHIRGFVRDAEQYASTSRGTVLHPLLNFEQIRSIPNPRDIELLLFSMFLLWISTLLAVSYLEGRSLAEFYPHWWAAFEVIGVLVFCHSLLRYTRHMVERDRTDWHRAYEQTRDFLLYRVISFLVVSAAVLWMYLILPSLEFPTSPEQLLVYQRPVLFLKVWCLIAFVYVLLWVLRLSGETVALMKVIGLAVTASGVVGAWLVAFSFDSDPEKWMFSALYHVCFTLAFLSLILLLFRENMVLLAATHRAAQIIAEEKKVMLDFLVRVADDPSLRLTPENPQRRVRQDLDYILRLTLNFAMSQSSAKAGAVYLLDSILEPGAKPEDGRFLVPRVVEGPFPPLQSLPIDYLATRIKYINELFLSETVELASYPFFKELMDSGKLLYLPDATRQRNLPQQPTDFLRIHTLIAVPLAMNGKVMGLLVVINKFSESEIGWAPFNPQDASLLNAVADQAAIALTSAKMHEVIDEQERLEREIEIARKVQESLLPSEFPDLDQYEIRAFSRAAKQIGGDFYDFVWMDPNRLAIVVADVAGKGIPGALTMAAIRSALRALVSKDLSARELTLNLNDFIYNDLKRDVFISLSLAILDISKKTLSLVRAGHEPTIVLKGGEDQPILLEPEGMALGLDRGSLFRQSLKEFTLPLDSGDLVVFYTDGLTEAMNEDFREFTLDRVLQVIRENKGQAVEQVVHRIQGEVDAFVGDRPPHDDVTLVILKVRPNGRP